MKKIKSIQLLMLILGISTILITCKKEDPPTIGTIQGTVKNATGMPIDGVIVEITPGGSSITTGGDGKYEFKDLLPKDYQLVAKKDGFVPNTQTVKVVVGETKTLDFAMAAFVPSLTVSQNALSATPAAGNNTVNVVTNIAWNASCDQTWCTVSPSSGTNNGTVTVTWAENTATVQRAATITVSGTGVLSQTITLTQTGVTPALSVSPTSKSIVADGENFDITVSSNIAWKVTAESWIILSQPTGTGNGTVTATCAANPNITQRTGTITFSGAGVSHQTITVTQAAKAISFSVSPGSQSVAPISGTTTFNVAANTTWSASETENWLSIAQAGTNGNGIITVTYTANSTTNQRTGTITISGTGFTSQTVTVKQEGVPLNLSVSPTSMTFSATGTISNPKITVTANTTWSASSDQDWCTITTKNGNNNGSTNVSCTANAGLDERTATITFSGTGGVADKTVSITQSGSKAYIAVATPTSGTNWMMSTTQTIQWSDNINEAVKVELYKGSILITILSASETGNSYNWNIPLTLTAGADYKIKITSTTTGSSYAESELFTISLFTGKLSDIDGNEYNTIQIGQQIWMKENLKVIHYRNGDGIENVTSNSSWMSLTTDAYCDYENNISNSNTYGKLYNWFVVSDNRKICPTGWHVPSDIEWTNLVSYLESVY